MHTKTRRQRKPDQTQTVLAALAHPRRRSMLDDLDTDIGWPLAYLREESPLTRQGVHKHLEVLVRAGIVIKSCDGRTALYYLDPRPIRKVFAELGRRYKRDMRPLANLDRFGSPDSPFD